MARQFIIYSARPDDEDRPLFLDFRPGPDENVLTLSPPPAETSQRQIFQITDDGRIANLGAPEQSRFLTRNLDGEGPPLVRLGPKIDDSDPRSSRQIWSFQHEGPFTFVMPVQGDPKGTESSFLLTDAVHSEEIAPHALLVSRRASRAAHAQRWLFIEQIPPRTQSGDPNKAALSDDGEPPAPVSAIYYHAGETCDATWHNPACPGNPATWLGTCTYVDGTCRCAHA